MDSVATLLSTVIAAAVLVVMVIMMATLQQPRGAGDECCDDVAHTDEAFEQQAVEQKLPKFTPSQLQVASGSEKPPAKPKTMTLYSTRSTVDDILDWTEVFKREKITARGIFVPMQYSSFIRGDALNTNLRALHALIFERDGQWVLLGFNAADGNIAPARRMIDFYRTEPFNLEPVMIGNTGYRLLLSFLEDRLKPLEYTGALPSEYHVYLQFDLPNDLAQPNIFILDLSALQQLQWRQDWPNYQLLHRVSDATSALELGAVFAVNEESKLVLVSGTLRFLTDYTLTIASNLFDYYHSMQVFVHVDRQPASSDLFLIIGDGDVQWLVVRFAHAYSPPSSQFTWGTTSFIFASRQGSERQWKVHSVFPLTTTFQECMFVRAPNGSRATDLSSRLRILPKSRETFPHASINRWNASSTQYMQLTDNGHWALAMSPNKRDLRVVSTYYDKAVAIFQLGGGIRVRSRDGQPAEPWADVVVPDNSNGDEWTFAQSNYTQFQPASFPSGNGYSWNTGIASPSTEIVDFLTFNLSMQGAIKFQNFKESLVTATNTIDIPIGPETPYDPSTSPYPDQFDGFEWFY